MRGDTWERFFFFFSNHMLRSMVWSGGLDSHVNWATFLLLGRGSTIGHSSFLVFSVYSLLLANICSGPVREPESFLPVGEVAPPWRLCICCWHTNQPSYWLLFIWHPTKAVVAAAALRASLWHPRPTRRKTPESQPIVLFDEATNDRLWKEVPNSELLTPAVVSEGL